MSMKRIASMIEDASNIGDSLYALKELAKEIATESDLVELKRAEMLIKVIETQVNIFDLEAMNDA